MMFKKSLTSCFVALLLFLGSFDASAGFCEIRLSPEMGALLDLRPVKLPVARRRLVETVVLISLEAGEATLEEFRKEKVEFVIKPDGSPVTQGDLRAHEIIVRRLKEFFPDIPVISEEAPIPSFEVRKKWKRYFIIDPIDGTKEFRDQIDEYTVNIALVEAGKPVFGVVLAPARKVIYFGAEGGGSWKKEADSPTKRIYSLPKKRTEPHRILMSRFNPKPQEVIHAREELGFNVTEEITLGSSLKFCWVAEGAADLLVRNSPINEWDVAAGDAVFRYSVKDGEAPRKSTIEYSTESLKTKPYIITASE